MMRRIALVAGLLAGPLTAAAQQPGDSTRATPAGVYTAAQAVRGRSLYLINCASCHTSASHTGPVFAAQWDNKLLWDL
ncbi:MAG TPA: hypothetical protein VFU23_09820, partial [Gemmatimonadales bacterium]|nr:hypothetical protein [Gemmatimonadales bacterium]